MDPLLTDEERWQQVKDWWKKNGTMLLVGVTIGLLAVIGWRQYQTSQTNKKTTASYNYENLRLQMIKRSPQFARLNKKADPKKLNEEAIKTAKAIVQKFPSSPYAVDASLILAKIYVESNDMASAQSYLELALSSLDKSDAKYYLAKMRLARVLRDKGEYGKALAQVPENTPAQFKKYFEYIKGTVYEGQKQCEPARDAYSNTIKIMNNEEENNKDQVPQNKEFKQLVEQRIENVRNC